MMYYHLGFKKSYSPPRLVSFVGVNPNSRPAFPLQMQKSMFVTCSKRREWLQHTFSSLCSLMKEEVKKPYALPIRFVSLKDQYIRDLTKDVKVVMQERELNLVGKLLWMQVLYVFPDILWMKPEARSGQIQLYHVIACQGCGSWAKSACPNVILNCFGNSQLLRLFPMNNLTMLWSLP